MSPEENLVALGLRQLPPTALADESVNRAIVAHVNGAHRDGPSPAENPSPNVESNFEAKREAVAGLATGELAPFVELAKRDPGFPFEADSVVALTRLAKDRRADFERLRSRLRADTHVRLPALENAMKGSAAGASSDAYNRPGQPIEYDEIDPWREPVDSAEDS